MTEYSKGDYAYALLKIGRHIIKEYMAYVKADKNLKENDKKTKATLTKEMVKLLKHLEAAE